jgi:hypothetical protein
MVSKRSAAPVRGKASLANASVGRLLLGHSRSAVAPLWWWRASRSGRATVGHRAVHAGVRAWIRDELFPDCSYVEINITACMLTARLS